MSVKKFYAVVGIIVALAVASAPGAIELIKWIETRYYPVTREAVVTHVEVIEDNPNSIVIWGSAEKVRNCRWEGTYWYRGTRPQPSVRIELKFEERDKIRLAAPFQFGPWRLFMRWEASPAPNPFTHTSFANAWHQCFVWGIPLPWLTKSHFYN